MPFKDLYCHAGPGIPDSCRLILRRRDHAPAVGTERGSRDRSLTSERNDRPSGCELPDLCRPIIGSRYYVSSIGAKAGAPDTEHFEDSGYLTLCPVPDSHGVILGGGDHVSTIAAEFDTGNSARMAVQDRDPCMPLQVPEARCFVMRCAEHALPIGAKHSTTHGLHMPIKYLERLAGFGVPQSHCLI